MKGKKVDADFLSQYISECITKNITDQEEIVKLAKSDIANIDAQIRKVEKLKITRSKLLDVISTFEKPASSNKEERKILSFFKIQKPEICKFICDSLKLKSIKIDDLHNKAYLTADIVFCIKQLIEHKVVSKIGANLIRGEMFEEYIKFILRED